MSVRVAYRWSAPEELDKVILKWNFDLPKAKSAVESSKVRIKGWVLTRENATVSLLIRDEVSKKTYPLNQARPDVISKILHEKPDAHPQLNCGFAYEIEIQHGAISIGFKIGRQNHWIGSLRLERMRKVLVGRNGNLFLDNDTNRCVEQYQGNYQLQESELSAWSHYVETLRQLELERLIRIAFIIAPGKEFVHAEDFPYSRGDRTPVDEIIQLFGADRRLVYPLADLAREGNLTYSIGDTHWTDYGALVAARMLCASLGDEFPSDIPRFNLVHANGDLNGKLVNPVLLPFFRADFSETTVVQVFTNEIHNHGRVRLYQNVNAPNTTRVLLFGDSFSVNLAPWLNLCYNEVLYVHTAGSIDLNLLGQFAPDLLIAQTNTRFLIKPPTIGIDVAALIIPKFKQMQCDELSGVKDRVTALNHSYLRSWTLQLIGLAENKQ